MLVLLLVTSDRSSSTPARNSSQKTRSWLTELWLVLFIIFLPLFRCLRRKQKKGFWFSGIQGFHGGIKKENKVAEEAPMETFSSDLFSPLPVELCLPFVFFPVCKVQRSFPEIGLLWEEGRSWGGWWWCQLRRWCLAMAKRDDDVCGSCGYFKRIFFYFLSRTMFFPLLRSWKSRDSQTITKFFLSWKVLPWNRTARSILKPEIAGAVAWRKRNYWDRWRCTKLDGENWEVHENRKLQNRGTVKENFSKNRWIFSYAKHTQNLVACMFRAFPLRSPGESYTTLPSTS